MSIYLIGFYNGNDEMVTLVNKETDESWSFESNSLTTTLNLRMPECSVSDLPADFAGNHLEVHHNGEVLFSFWTDPEDNYRIKHCTGAKWLNGVIATRGYKPTDGDDVGVAVVNVNQTQEIRSWRSD